MEIVRRFEFMSNPWSKKGGESSLLELMPDLADSLTLLHRDSACHIDPLNSCSRAANIYRINHPEFGFDTPADCIGSNQYESLDQALAKTDSSKKTILNLGDSTTAGFDSNWSGTQYPEKIMFGYKTYSRFLEDEYNSINIGVPGFTSHQAKLKLKSILKRMKDENKLPDFVTIYIGNNDRRYGMPHSKWLGGEDPDKEEGVRVTLRQFTNNIKEMISLIREYGAKPILIRPLSNYFNPPCVHTHLPEDHEINSLDPNLDSRNKLRLTIAQRLWTMGYRDGALEFDTLLARIKKDYVDALHKISADLSVPIIDLQSELEITSQEEAKKIFLDPCHPCEDIHKLIAEKVTRTMEEYPSDIASKFIAAGQETDGILRTTLGVILELLLNLIPITSKDRQNDKMYPHS